MNDHYRINLCVNMFFIINIFAILIANAHTDVPTFPIHCVRPNEHYECGSPCQTECFTDFCNIASFRCNDACFCDEGYARDLTSACVQKSQCKNKLNNICGKNEEVKIDTYLNSECHPTNGDGRPPIKNDFESYDKVKGCFCISGYKRNNSGDCIPERECPVARPPPPGVSTNNK